MNRIELYITINQTGNAYKCDIVEGAKSWKAVLYQKDFEYSTIEEPTIWKCLESLAQKIDTLGDVDEIDGKGKQIFLAILRGHIMRLKARRSAEGEQYG